MQICPVCGTANDPADEVCFKCAKGLSAITEGSVIGGRYEIRGRLGRGGMGVVYRAHDQELDEIVALKVLRSDAAASPELAKRFRSEIKLARRVTHPNVCRIHELGKEGALSYIVMECVDGVDLRRVLRERGRLPPAEAFDVSLQIAGALQAIHAEGIVHRDLKTPNVMLSTRNVVKLMDFGIARSLESTTTFATAAGQIVGTPEYMSPEQARGVKLDGRSDIYALGIVIFELFTGEVPFRGDTPVATLFKHIEDPPPLEEARELPRPVVPVLSRALAKAPEERFQTASQLGEALRAARAQFFPDATPTWTPPPTRSDGEPLPDLEGETTPMPAPRPTPTAVPTAVPTKKAGLPTPATSGPTPPRASDVPGRSRPAARVARPVGRLPARGNRSIRVVAGTIAFVVMTIGTVLFILSLRPPGPGRGDSAGQSEPPVRVADSAGPPAIPTAPPTPTPEATPSTEVSSAPRPRSLATPTPPSPRPPRVTPLPPVVTTLAASPSTTVPVTNPQSPGSGNATPGPSEGTAPPGALQLLVVPWAEVEVDGVRVGVSPPLKPLSLPPGVHTVRLTHPDYLPLPHKITIRPGETTRLQVDLTKEGLPK